MANKDNSSTRAALVARGLLNPSSVQIQHRHHSDKGQSKQDALAARRAEMGFKPVVTVKSK